MEKTMDKKATVIKIIVIMSLIYLICNVLIDKYLGLSLAGYALVSLVMGLAFGRIGRAIYQDMTGQNP